MIAASIWTRSTVSLRLQWRRFGPLVLATAAVAMLIVGAGRLDYAIPYLLTDVESWAAIDLKYRFEEVRRWFMGLSVYDVLRSAVYAPASYVMLWPFMGWLSLDEARWMWCVTMLVSIVAIALVAVKAAGATSLAEKAFIALTVASVYPIQMTVYVGQVGVHVVAFIAAGVFVLKVGRGRWWADLMAAMLFVLALIKPTLSAPFIWILLFAVHRLRPFVIVVLLYAALTAVAAFFQQTDPVTLLATWLQQSNEMSVPEGYSNIHKLLYLVGAESWMMPGSVMMLLVAGVWVYVYRTADWWLLVGVAALVARFWIHHRPYDDILLILPLIALFRVSKRSVEGDWDVIAAIGLAVLWALLQIPTWAFYILPQPAPMIIEIAQITVWICVLVFLFIVVHRTVHSAARLAPPG